MEAPLFNTKFVCIIDSKNVTLAAVISSYAQEKGTFLSTFEFPSVTIEKPIKHIETIDKHSISRIRGAESSTFIYNSINKIGQFDFLILAGLDTRQKSYLDYIDQYNVLEIDNIEDVEPYLSGLSYEKDEFLVTHPDDALLGLLIAGRNNQKLNFDNNAQKTVLPSAKKSGLIIIENNKKTSAISAINYALSIDSDIHIIPDLSVNDEQRITSLIEDWKKGNDSSYHELYSLLYSRLEGIDFSKYKFATFFTSGAPYSLIIKNQLPVSYVHLNQNPNIFIVNNIFIENKSAIGSAVVFSPLEFGLDEETKFVIDTFKKANFWVKELIGDNASSFNIDMHVKEYPYDFFHICSHGGEVNGYSITREFIDRNGVKHIVEYDDVISFQPSIGEKLIKLEYKHIWRKFDGHLWMSKELREQNYPDYVFTDMLNAVINNKNIKGNTTKTPKAIVANSCAIKCSDFIYQAMFNMVAHLHTSPIIFNNTCWSWSKISLPFLNSGARGYIGTIWAVNNTVAKEVAEYFYRDFHNDTIVNILHNTYQKTEGTNSEGVYAYWGLHFSTFKRAYTTENSRQNIAKCLSDAFKTWTNRTTDLPEGNVKNDTIKLAEWNYTEFSKYFQKEINEIVN